MLHFGEKFGYFSFGGAWDEAEPGPKQEFKNDRRHRHGNLRQACRQRLNTNQVHDSEQVRFP